MFNIKLKDKVKIKAYQTNIDNADSNAGEQTSMNIEQWA